MDRKPLNTEADGYRLYRALLPLLTKMRQMDDRMLIGFWGCELVEYPAGIKIGLHVVTHPKPHITQAEMPILNVGAFDRGILRTVLTNAIKDEFPGFSSYACELRITTYVHTATNRIFNYIYSSELGEIKIPIDVTDVAEVTPVDAEPEPQMSRQEVIYQTIADDYWSRIQDVCASKGYHVPDLIPDFLSTMTGVEQRLANTTTRVRIDGVKRICRLIIFAYNPKLTEAQVGSAIIRRNIPKLIPILDDLRRACPECDVATEFSIGVVPSTLAHADVFPLQPPAELRAVCDAIEQQNPSPPFMSLDDGRWLYRQSRGGDVWYLMYTTRDMTDAGYPAHPNIVQMAAVLLGILPTFEGGPQALYTIGVSGRGLMTYSGYRPNRKWLHRSVLRELKIAVQIRINTMSHDDPELPSAVWCTHTLSPRRMDTFSAEALKLFLENVPLHWTPSLLRMLIMQYSHKNNGQHGNAGWPKKVQNAYNTIVERKLRDHLWSFVDDSKPLPPEWVAKIRNRQILNEDVDVDTVRNAFRIRDLQDLVGKRVQEIVIQR